MARLPWAKKSNTIFNTGPKVNNTSINIIVFVVVRVELRELSQISYNN